MRETTKNNHETNRNSRTGSARDDKNEKGKKNEKNVLEQLREYNVGGKFAGGGRGSVTGIVAGGFKGAVHELPYRSLTLFLATFMVATVAGILVIPVGVAVSGSVWTVMVSIGFTAVVLIVACMVSLANFVRGLIGALSTSFASGREGGSVALVDALFRGYFGGIIQAGCILLIYRFLVSAALGLFVIPMIYFIPIEVLGFTVPIPIPLGWSGSYIAVSIYVVVTVVLLGSFLMGGIELLQAFRDQVDDGEGNGAGGGSQLQRAAMYLLFLTLFPAVNILLCSYLVGAYSSIIFTGV